MLIKRLGVWIMFASISWNRNMTTLAPALVLIVLYVAFSMLSREFATAANLQNIVLYAALLLMVASSSAFVILLGCIDLSVGAVATAAGVATALLVPQLGVAAPPVGAGRWSAFGAVKGVLP